VIAAGTVSGSFVLLQMGARRFALPAEIVTELAPPVRLHEFPHTSAMLSGVIVRRSHIVPVYEASSVLIGRRFLAHRFYLIARREFPTSSELGAIPVDGECELASGEVRPPEPGQPPYVQGRLAVGQEFVDILDFDSLVAQRLAASGSANRGEAPL
jgi:chemotaxis signal transduction protein